MANHDLDLRMLQRTNQRRTEEMFAAFVAGTRLATGEHLANFDFDAALFDTALVDAFNEWLERL